MPCVWFVALVQLAILFGKCGCNSNINAYTEENIPDDISIFNTRQHTTQHNNIGIAAHDKLSQIIDKFERRLNRPFIASPEQQQTSVCTSCYALGNSCFWTGIATTAFCEVSNVLFPSFAMTFADRPFKGLTVSGGNLCRIIAAPRTIQCTINTWSCYLKHSCGLISPNLINFINSIRGK